MFAIAIFSTHGVVRFTEHTMSFYLTNFKPYETHAIHIHMWGDMSDGCTSLGPHYDNYEVGQNPHGAHLGDLFFNFTTNARGEFRFTAPHTLNLIDIYGRSIVIHDLQDDLGIIGLEIDAYPSWDSDRLNRLCKQLGIKERTKEGKIGALVKGSLENGNAGARLDCAIIARSQQ